jgi:hypothetical protein
LDEILSFMIKKFPKTFRPKWSFVTSIDCSRVYGLVSAVVMV